jgi:molecular chaperone HtpG
VKFSRVDADLDDALLDKGKKAKSLIPNTNKTRDEEIKSLFEAALNKPTLNVRTEALKTENPDTPPAMVLLPEANSPDAGNDGDDAANQCEFPEEHVLLVNTAHPLIKNLSKLKQSAIVQAGWQ